MWKNYLKIASRNLLKEKANSLIKIGGLAIGLVCCIAISFFVLDEYSFDRFHKNYGEIYRIVEEQIQGGDIYHVAVTPGPLAPVLKSDYEEVKETVRIGRFWQPVIVKTEQQSLESKSILITENSFFNVFDFPMVQGNSSFALNDVSDVVITEIFASKLFGPDWASQSLIGKQITFDNTKQLQIAGVVQDPPANSHIQFEMLTSFKVEESSKYNYNWGSNNFHTYVMLDDRSDDKAFESKIEPIFKEYSSDTTTKLAIQPFSDIYLYSDFDFQTDWSKTGNVAYIRIFVSVGIIVLLIAIFNFINLSTASAFNRTKEVNVRKIMGAMRGQLIYQFLTEAFIVSFIAILLALVLFQLVLPILNEITGKEMVLPFQTITFPLILFLGTVLLSLLAGVYPAFFLSRFKNSKFQSVGIGSDTKNQSFGKFLIVVQFTFAMVLMVSTVTIYRQLDFLQQRELGFDKSHLVSVYLKKGIKDKSELYKSDLLGQSSISQVSLASSNLINLTTSSDNVDWEGNDLETKILWAHMNVDPDFLPTTGMELVSGRNFDFKMSSDTASFILNETAVKELGWTSEEALGKEFSFWDQPGTVIGVVKDFNYRPMNVPVGPMILRNWPQNSKSILLARIRENQVKEAVASIESFYKKYDQESEFQFSFVDQALDRQYRADQIAGKIVMSFSILAIVIACFGLVGLAAYSAGRRTKEIGVRKVLGASSPTILLMLSKEFLLLLVLAFVVASPVAFWISSNWLSDYAFRIDLEWWFFVGAGILTMAIALFTVGTQSLKAALMNPVNSLRDE